ncbi:6913_t:CDS:2 [Paraglomus occultum]|uniref:6913_t:CDS:1 n=1 Tax=Paraglomus occultum TaxID=144539 RepID=A0A9N9F3T3_9GLOM|nr:6913_t:CDS:2 [Paraglomus occultum]
MLKAPTSFRARTLSTESRDGLNSAADTHSTDVARRRTQKKDESIRKRTEQELLKLNPGRRGRDRTPPPRIGGTVGNLRPLAAIILSESDTAYDAARFMTVKRADAVLVTDVNGQLSGIVTDKDLAFRVIAEGLDPHNTYLGEIMTRNPCTVTTAHNATDALNEMVNGGFRHLPVTDNRTEKIVGILDITECLLDALAKLERANRSTKQLSDVLDTMSEFESSHNREVASYVRVLREQLGFPQLQTILDPTKSPAEVSLRTNVREIARVMKEKHQTAVLVLDEDGRTVGIFTSKDLVVRVIAGKLEPSTTSAVRVMTPNPDTASPETTILDALRTMQEGRYQHLPLFDKANGIVGIVDILQLTYATLRTVNPNIISSLNTLEYPHSTTFSISPPSVCKIMLTPPDSPTSGQILMPLKDCKPSKIPICTNSKRPSKLYKTFTRTSIKLSNPKPPPQSSLPTPPSSSPHTPELCSPFLGPQLVSTTTQLQHMEGQEGDGPVWSKFWNAVSLEDASSERTLSDQRVLSSGSGDMPSIKEASNRATTPSSEEQMAESRRYSETTSSKVKVTVPGSMMYKFKDPQTGQTHRFSSICREYREFLTLIKQKMSLKTEEVVYVSYIDDENDKVALSSDEDLANALQLAKRSRWTLIRLDVKMPEKVMSERNQIPRSNDDIIKEYMFISGGSFAVGVVVGGIFMWALRK